jgi:hypothetical protein
MTTTRSFTVTTTQIRRGANTVLSISYDYTGLGTSILVLPMQRTLQSLIDQAITQWWSGLTAFQKSAPSDRSLNLKISASYLKE